MKNNLKINPRKAREIHYFDYNPNFLENKNILEKMKEGIENNDVYIIRRMVEPNLIKDIKKYLINIGRNSLPSYHLLEENCPDFHRINQFDNRSYVKSLMHQFMFHPWNQNTFNFFDKFSHIYYLKNLVSGLKSKSFLNSTPMSGYIARLSFQFYPVGGGCIKKHADPIADHQICVPVMSMSKKGQDFYKGGAYVINEKDEEINTDELMDLGDVIFFNAELIHGVKPVDPEENLNWLSYSGRWILLISVIKSVINKSTPNSLQIEK